ncbi:RNA polymerase subunit sigma-70 [Streptomyces sp. NBC_01537]|uniref:sigma factor-like helix-turn-helix DNA-binding protein n=1 Tax=Streptomyces sp. NBC_01537 TaxID=2903896 RepID=UPI0038665A9B
MRLIASSRTEPSAPASAFDSLHTHCASPLVRQVELLTGNPRLARRAVRHAFGLAWQHWPAVAVDPDPVAWIRAAAYDHALAPWRRRLPGRRPRRRATTGPAVALRTALLRLPPASRRTVLLYDGLGLDLPETAAETAASTAAAAARIMRARAALGEGAGTRLAELLQSPDEAHTARQTPASVRRRSERRIRCQTLGALALTAAVAAGIGAAVVLEPAHRTAAPPPAAASVREPPNTQDSTEDTELRRGASSCTPYDAWCGEAAPR